MLVLRDQLETTEKQVVEKLLLYFDYGDDVADYVNVASIVSVTATSKGLVVGSTDLVVSGQACDGQKVVAFFAGGTNGETYLVEAVAIMTNGEELARSALLLVKDLT